MSHKTVIYNAEIVNEYSRFIGYVIITDEFISRIGTGEIPTEILNEANEVIDATGLLLMPGVIDDQVHFRDPGLIHKGDIITESMAAVAGGTTSYMDMPNTKPPTTSIEALEAKYRRAEEVSAANFSFFAGGTNDNIETLKKIDFTSTCGVKLFLGSSTGNMLVDNQDTIKKIFSEIPAIIAIHSEDEAIINANKKMYVDKYGDNLPISYHPLIRSAEACYECTARAVEIAEKTNARLHVLHLSTEKELTLFSNMPLADKRITAEVCVHHLWFSDKDYSTLGNRIKCNPAIKKESDRNALRAALKSGIIDIVATDHAPHLLSEKEGNCLVAASGMPLIQYSLVAMLEMARDGIFSIEEVVSKMCHAPAMLYKISQRGFIREGYYADIVLIDLKASHTVLSADIISRCGWSPFEGTTFQSAIKTTFVNGHKIYNNGKFDLSHKGMRLRFNY